MSSNNLKQAISEIENTVLKGLNGRPSKICSIELTPETHLLTNLAGSYGALIIRSILYQLGVDENRIFQWRLENKFRQYQILNYYIPGCMPETFALSTILSQDDGEQKARELFANDFFLKATLGDASFVTNSWNKTHLFDKIKQQYPNSAAYEEYMIQKKMKLFREFRVHTFHREIIPLLTYRIPATQDTNIHQGAEYFVTMILSKLPDQILHGTLIGWDIGLTNTGQYYVIESNLTGFHPEYRCGFQTTGYVDSYEYGPIISAWLNNYFRAHYGVCISSIDPALSAGYPFCRAFELYSAILKKSSVDAILTRQQPSPVSVLIYISASSNILVNLINHFHQVDFAKNYYVITSHTDHVLVSSIFKKKPKVKVIDETELFTFPQYQVIAQMEDNKRKQICCLHAARKLKETYLII